MAQATGQLRAYRIALALTTAAGVIQLTPFVIGHNLTADDTMFQLLSRELGWADRISEALAAANLHQRIPLFFSNLLSMSVSGSIDTLAIRMANLAVFAACFAAFAVHCRRLFGAVPAALFALVAVATSPLAFHHMPPTSYPFFPTVQVLVWLLIRFALLRSSPGGSFLRHIGLRVAEGIVLLSSEYVLFFAAPLMALQWLARATPRPRALLTLPLLRGDVVTLALVVLVQVAHRIALPGSGYISVGETSFGLVDVLRVAALHAWHGTVFAYVGSGAWLDRPWPEIVAALVLALAVAAAALLLPPARHRTRAALLMVPAGLALALSITLPIAAMDKYLGWCLQGQACAYIESRFAGWALMLALAGPLALAYTRLPARWRILPAVVLGIGAAATLLNNISVSESMWATTQPWRDAARLACLFPDARDAHAEALAELLTAKDIQWHASLGRRRRQRYWAGHLAALRADPGPCGAPPIVAPGRRVELQGADGTNAWVVGWDRPTAFPLLASSRYGAVALHVATPLAEDATLMLELGVQHPRERVEVRLKHGALCRAVLPAGVSRLAIPVGPRPAGATVAVLVSMLPMSEGDAVGTPPAMLRPYVEPLAATVAAATPDALPCQSVP